jgi:hypothetical protein
MRAALLLCAAWLVIAPLAVAFAEDTPQAQGEQTVVETAGSGDVAPVQNEQPSQPIDDRFGVIVSGQTEDGVTADATAATSLNLLGVHWWYSFDNTPTQVPTATRVQLARPANALPEIQARATANPGAYWLLGNEPNVPGQDDIPPEQFAVWYHDTVAAIQAADPSARFVGPNGLNWDSTCSSCLGFPSAHAWSDVFISSYLALYGVNPPLDVWGMHTYDIDWQHPPLANAPQSWDEIEAVRQWLDSQPELAGKPIWITEFGVIFGYGGYHGERIGNETIIVPDGPFRRDVLNAYVQDMTGWLTTRGVELDVQKWFVYSALPAREPYQSTPAGLSMLTGMADSLVVTDQGRWYLQYQSSGRAGDGVCGEDGCT